MAGETGALFMFWSGGAMNHKYMNPIAAHVMAHDGMLAKKG